MLFHQGSGRIVPPLTLAFAILWFVYERVVRPNSSLRKDLRWRKEE